jgi:hypothetical protein
MLLSSYNCPLIWENMASSPLTLALQIAAKPLYSPGDAVSPYNIVDAAAITVDNETGGDSSSIGAWDAETKMSTSTVGLCNA